MNISKVLLLLNTRKNSQYNFFIKKLSKSSRVKTNEAVSKSDFIPVYKFNQVKAFSLINRLKLYQTVLTFLSIPASEILSSFGYIDNQYMMVTSVIGFAGCGALYSIGHFTAKFVGILYYNEQKHIAKISYIDYWGRRKDIEIPKDDLIPLSELPKTPTDPFYFTLRRYSMKDTLKLSKHFAEVLDSEKFKKVFVT